MKLPLTAEEAKSLREDTRFELAVSDTNIGCGVFQIFNLASVPIKAVAGSLLKALDQIEEQTGALFLLFSDDTKDTNVGYEEALEAGVIIVFSDTTHSLAFSQLKKFATRSLVTTNVNTRNKIAVWTLTPSQIIRFFKYVKNAEKTREEMAKRAEKKKK